jgi:hypothetical protein
MKPRERLAMAGCLAILCAIAVMAATPNAILEAVR